MSFSTRRSVAITASTRHYPDSYSGNVVAVIEGTDPVLKHEAIVIGAHLDRVGNPGMVFPVALDNASGVADLPGAARALATSKIKPASSVVFGFFDGEEYGLYGSKAFVEEQIWPKN